MSSKLVEVLCGNGLCTVMLVQDEVWAYYCLSHCRLKPFESQCPQHELFQDAHL